MDNVQKNNTCINVPSSQTFTSYLLCYRHELNPVERVWSIVNNRVAVKILFSKLMT
jgi:transposase